MQIPGKGSRICCGPLGKSCASKESCKPILANPQTERAMVKQKTQSPNHTKQAAKLLQSTQNVLMLRMSAVNQAQINIVLHLQAWRMQMKGEAEIQEDESQEKAERLQEKEKGHSSLDQLVQTFRDSWDSLCDVEITGVKVKMSNRDRSKNYYLQGEELREILGPDVEALEEAFISSVWISVAGGGGGSGGWWGLGLGSWVEGFGEGVRDLGGRGYAQREKCSYFVHICSGLFIFVHILFIFVQYLFIFVHILFIFVHICSFLFIFVHICSYLFIFGCGHVASNYVQILPIFVV